MDSLDRVPTPYNHLSSSPSNLVPPPRPSSSASSASSTSPFHTSASASTSGSRPSSPFPPLPLHHDLRGSFSTTPISRSSTPSSSLHQLQAPLDEAFHLQQHHLANSKPFGQAAYSQQENHHKHNYEVEDVKSHYHLPTQPFDSFETLAGLKASPDTVQIPSRQGVSPGPSAQSLSAATAKAFASVPLQPIHDNMPLVQGNAGLDPSIPSFAPTNQPRKSSFAIPIVDPATRGSIDSDLSLSPANSRNSSISSDGSGASRDPEDESENEGKDEKVVFKSPAKKALEPLHVGQHSPSSGTVTPNGKQSLPGTPPRVIGIPSIQTTAATPLKARYSPTALGHRRNDSMVGPSDDEDEDHESPKRSRTSSGGSSMRQGSVQSLGRKTSMASMTTINENSAEKRTLWFGDLEPWMDDNYMRSISTMMAWDVDNIKLIRPSLTGNNAGSAPMNAGYCFITFNTMEEALRILTILTPSATNAPVPMPNASRNFRANWASGATVANPFTAPTALPPTDGKEYSIFVGDLAPTVTEDVLIQTFMEPPETLDGVKVRGFRGVRGAKVMTDPVTGMSKMYGFVRFSDEDEQQRALVEMQGVPCLARAMRISPATTRARTASGAVSASPANIARSVTPDYLLPGKSGSVSGPSPAAEAAPAARAPSPVPAPVISAPVAVPVATEVPSLVNPFTQSLSAVSPAGPTPGEIAIAADPSLAVSLSQIKMLASTPSMPNPNGPPVHHTVAFNDPTNTTVFVGGLSPIVTEDMLRAFFVPFGEINKVSVPLGKKCGFVHFTSKADAERSIEKLQGFPLAGGQLRLSWGKSSTVSKPAAAPAAAAAAPAMAAPQAGNPLAAQILALQQQIAALTAVASQSGNLGGMMGVPSPVGSVPNLAISPGSTASYSPITPHGAHDPLAALALSDPSLFSNLLATNPGAFAGALGNGLSRSSFSGGLGGVDTNILAQLQANQQMLQLQAMQMQLGQDEPSLGKFSPFSPNPAAEAALRQKDANPFWTATNPPMPKRSVSPFSQAAQAMAERASERNSGRTRHSTSPGERVTFLTTEHPSRRVSSGGPGRYGGMGNGTPMDSVPEMRQRTKSESLKQTFERLHAGNAGGPNASWLGAQGRAQSYSDGPRGHSDSPQRRLGGGSFA